MVGALGATAAFLVVLVGGHLSLLQPAWRGNFYDVQAHSLLHLRWDVAPGSLGNEGFVIHGKTYMYFGPWPALLRLPVAAITDNFDDRLTQVSMLIGFALVLAATARLAWQVRALTRGDESLDRVELSVIAGYVVMVGVGTPILYIATEPIVYNEAVIWGLAWAMLTISAVIGFAVTRRRSQLLLAAFCAMGAVMSRASLGVTALLAIGLFAVAAALPMSWRSALGLRELALTPRDAVGLGGSCLLAAVLYAYVNVARFGTLLSVPFSKQLYESRFPVRLHDLQLNGGGLFSVKFIPTTMRQYFRPDAIGLHWPWPTLRTTASALFGAKLDLPVGPTSSVVDSMLAFSALALVGVVWVVRRSPEVPSKHILVVTLAATIVGSGATLSYGYVAQRYIVDFMPLIVLTSLIGLNASIDWFRSSKRAARKIASAGLLVLVALNVWVSIGFARVGELGRQHDEVCAALSLVRDCNPIRLNHR